MSDKSLEQGMAPGAPDGATEASEGETRLETPGAAEPKGPNDEPFAPAVGGHEATPEQHQHDDTCNDNHCGCGDEHEGHHHDHCGCGDDHCGCGDEHCGCDSCERDEDVAPLNEENISFVYTVKGLDCPSCA